MTAEAPEHVMWTPDPMRRIELDPVHVHADDLVGGRYERAGDSEEVLRLSKPFAIELPILDVTP